MSLIELVTDVGIQTKVKIPLDKRYQARNEAKKVLGDFDYKDLVFPLMELTGSRNLNQLVANLYVPHSHFFLYTIEHSSFKIGCQVRSNKKQSFKGLTLALTAGGHVFADDFSRVEDVNDSEQVIDAFRHGGWREGIEELRNETKRLAAEGNPIPFNINENEFVRVPGVAGVYDFSGNGLPTEIYLEIFAAKYDESTNGTIFTGNGTKRIEWLCISDIERRGLHKPLGRAGEAMLKYAKSIRGSKP